ncbi:MAG: solute carrier family 23 protein [bacterium]
MLDKFFKLSEHGINVRTEVLAGLTTFLTMSYIIVVNPAILQKAGIPEGPQMVATILCAVIGTLLMGLYANKPFGLAPYMGENAFVAFTKGIK